MSNDSLSDEMFHRQQHNNGWKYVCAYDGCDWEGYAMSTWVIHEGRHHE